MSRLNDIIRHVAARDPQLAKDLQRETDALADRRAFGLNFERHVPEAVELPGRSVRKNDKVHILPDRGENPTKENERLYRVTDIIPEGRDLWANVQAVDDPTEEWSVQVEDLVVVAEFRDPIYPGLVSTGRVERGGDKPFHTVINAENYHALQALLFTHRGKVDAIYIDPPYNTGSDDWIYNDHYVESEDHYRHSKWLAFIERRLLLAQQLLTDAGVIIVAIGNDEHHRLRMLLDQVFGAENFLANLVWQGGVSALAKHTGGGIDYMLVYARNRAAHIASIGQWRIPKEGTSEVLTAGRTCWEASGGDHEKATELFRAWWRPNRKRFESGVSSYDRIDETGRVFFAGDLANGMFRPNLQYDIPHPVTGKPVRMPRNGWRHEPERMRANIAAGLVIFGPDEATIPTLKRYLEDYVTQVPAPTFYKDRRAATVHLAKVLGEQRFPNPKDVSTIATWIRTVTREDAVVLDFFGGSGTTVEAVMQLNAEGNSARQCILVTNNEVSERDANRLRKEGCRPGDEDWEARGVHERVTRPRILTVATGTRADGSEFSDGFEENVEFFTLTYASAMRVSSNREFTKVAPLLWLRAGSRGRRIDDLSEGWDVADAYGVIANLDQAEPFINAVEAEENLTHAFIVTDEDRLFEAMVRQLPEHVEPVRLYSSYLRNFEIEAGRAAR